jgi:hypothetical protein
MKITKEELEKMSTQMLPTEISSFTPQKIQLDNPKEVQSAIKGYFQFCQNNNKPPTANGLAYSLNTNWETIRATMNDSSSLLSEILKNAVTQMAAQVEERLLTQPHTAGSFAWLKNIMSWTDRTENVHIKQVTAADVVKKLREGQDYEVIDADITNNN